ncbi:hypothetical protein KI387_017000, partial [Taxus chinensis]
MSNQSSLRVCPEFRHFPWCTQVPKRLLDGTSTSMGEIHIGSGKEEGLDKDYEDVNNLDTDVEFDMDDEDDVDWLPHTYHSNPEERGLKLKSHSLLQRINDDYRACIEEEEE